MNAQEKYDAKYDADIAALAVKVNLDEMKRLLEDALEKMILIEEPQLYAKLEELGVDPQYYPYYAAFFKRVIELGSKFWNHTFNQSYQLLIYEFSERGHDLKVLEAVGAVALEKIMRRRGIEEFELLFSEDWSYMEAEYQIVFSEDWGYMEAENFAMVFNEKWSS